ncbi:MAG: hypothetical protein OJF52_003352 [Nitrospira sp.]|nr:MAG: hypothetical protein OJF52_003352 [Nitrospira sp.]
MKRTLISRWKRVAVMWCFLAVLIPVRAIAMDAGSEGWLDQLTGFVVVQEGIARASSEPGSFDPYVGQVTLVRGLYDRGDWKGAYMAMNRLMDMLESREGGISAGAADAIWNYCYEVTPPGLHDVKRHQQWWDKTVNWEQFFWEE